MKKLFKRIFIFGLVFILNALFIIAIDAYNIFFDSNFIEDEYKKLSLKRSNESMPRGNALWKLNEFTKNPCPNIIIGDSKSMGFDTDIINEITNEEYYNFGIPGGNYKTINDVFWFANDKTQLKNVVIQAGFGSYNKRVNYDLLSSVNPYLKQPFKMFFKNWYIFDSFSALQYKILKKRKISDEMDAIRTRERNAANWEDIKQRQGYAVLRNHTYPENYYADLEKISDYCQLNNINLTFVILPSHPDFYSIIEEMELSGARERFLQDIKTLGKTFDYSTSNKLTKDETLYLDIHHVKHSILDSLSYEIWQ